MAQESPAESVDHQVMLLARELRSDRQEERVQAQRKLATLGGPAIPAIERTTARAALDQLPYLMSALERMFVAGCLSEADEAERALERLSGSDRSAVSGRATAILTAHQQLREQRAIAALRELGADVVLEPVASESALMMPVWPTSEIVIPGHQLTNIEVWLHDDMAGGEEALRHVTRLEHNWSVQTRGITVYSIDGNGLSSDSVHSLAGRLNNANILERGPSLGISCDPRFGGCTIKAALPGGTAAAVGLGEGEEILAMDGEPVLSFGDLVSRLRDRSFGESVTLTCSRYGNVPREIEVTLQNWRPVINERIREIRRRPRSGYSSFRDEIPDPIVPVR